MTSFTSDKFSWDVRQGDALSEMSAMDADSIDCVVTSPPYNCRIPYSGFTDEVPWQDWYATMGDVIGGLLRIVRPGGVVAIVLPFVVRYQRDHRWVETWQDYNPDWVGHRGAEKVSGRGRIEPTGFRVFDMMAGAGFMLREPIIWVKGSEGNAICSDYRMGCDSDPYMRPSHEVILLASKERWYHDGGTGRRGKDAVPFLEETKDVWFIPPRSNKDHPAVFPLELPLRILRLFVHRANKQLLPRPHIADPFCGIGTTGLAAVELGYDFTGIDTSKEYCQTARKRLEKATRQKQHKLEL